MKVSIGDLVDRYTILELKKERTNLNVRDEYETYKKAIEKYYSNKEHKFLIQGTIYNLKLINGQIWDLESDIRKGKEDKLGLEEVGKRALEIRDKNKMRVQLKNTLNESLNEGVQDVKKNHASE